MSETKEREVNICSHCGNKYHDVEHEDSPYCSDYCEGLSIVDSPFFEGGRVYE